MSEFSAISNFLKYQMKRLAFKHLQAVYDFKLRLSVAGSNNIDTYLKDTTVQAEIDRCRYARCTGKNITTFIINDDPEIIQILSASMLHKLEGLMSASSKIVCSK